MIYHLLAVLWLAGAFATYGLSFAYFQNKYTELAEKKYRRDIIFCLSIALSLGFLGPLAFRIAMGNDAFDYGFRVW